MPKSVQTSRLSGGPKRVDTAPVPGCALGWLYHPTGPDRGSTGAVPRMFLCSDLLTLDYLHPALFLFCFLVCFVLVLSRLATFAVGLGLEVLLVAALGIFYLDFQYFCQAHLLGRRRYLKSSIFLLALNLLACPHGKQPRY